MKTREQLYNECPILRVRDYADFNGLMDWFEEESELARLRRINEGLVGAVQAWEEWYQDKSDPRLIESLGPVVRIMYKALAAAKEE